MRSINGQSRLRAALAAKESRGGGWRRSWLAIGVAVVLLALAACGGGGGGGGQESGEVILGQPGPGDTGNHFPFNVGNVWSYQGTRAEAGLPPETFVNTLTITGTRQVGGVTVTVFQDSNPDNLGAPEETFLVKDLNGIADFGNSDPTDTFTPLLVPFWEARFPLTAGTSFVQLSRAGLSLGEDLDEDGINDRVDLRGVVKMIGFEAVTVPAGTFAACAKFEQNIDLIIILSRDNSRVTSTGVLTLWFAPNIGLVKRVGVTTIPSFAFAETVTEELIGYAVAGQSSQISLQVNPSTVAILSGGLTQLSATAVNPGGAPVAVIPVTWTSSNPAVASVNANGQVIGLAFGSATITASLGDIVSNPVTVTVNAAAPQFIQVSPSPVSVAIGGTAQLAATGRDQFNNIISGLTFIWQSANSAVASVDANGLVSGIATGTTTITASNGTLSSLPVSVTVSDFRQLALATNDLLFDPVTLKIYASIPSRAGVNGDSVAIINPESGQVESFIPVGSEPKKLALSDDGRFLYVALDGTGSVARLDFNNPAAPVLDLTFSLGSDSFSTPFFVEDMEVMPGARQTVAISRMFKSTIPRHGGVAIFDNGVQRATTTPGHTGSNVIEFSSLPGILYGYNNETTESGFRRMAVDAAGVTVLTVDSSFTSNLISAAADIEFADGLIYATSGSVIDPEARTLSGTIAAGIDFGAKIEPDPNSGRVFFLSLTSQVLLPWTLRAFNIQTLTLAASEAPPTFSGSPLNLIRWGSNGLAFGTTGDQVMLVRTSLIP